ncbi:zinc finger TRAF-type-containing protein 1-B [Magallana gigas]|uniref:zinc finger TRAF-type-containing protein 1-B n=1 Tax=Magallana gigas TaxID=29159 RepID=UPI0005C3D421|nr:cysteine and histidine-rich protein 1 [Crassostrea gigas]|eukprot:XP_011438485.1 PREDICTED: cysteine and histidine-rich protein 1-like [Crassostrea gigas]
MADIPGPSTLVLQDENCNKENLDTNFEPERKKLKTEINLKEKDNKLEDRLSGILCCAVCLDLPRTCFQCTNGHLMCAGCYNHLLADARLKDETATCPNCRCEINKNSCTRNLAVEKAVSELPSLCQYCSCQLPRNQVDHHQRELCLERHTCCKYSRIGCPWQGPFHELASHEQSCIHPNKSGDDIMNALSLVDKQKEEELRVYSNLYCLLSYEKVTFNDLQLKPYRTDDFITRLYYETSRFSAFNHQWVIKARINNDKPTQSVTRSMSYQLVLKGKVTNPIQLKFIALKGPYGDMKVNPAIYMFEFSPENVETEYFDLPIVSSLECNKLLASKTINLRVIMVHLQ